MPQYIVSKPQRIKKKKKKTFDQKFKNLIL